MKLSFSLPYKTCWGESLHVLLYRTHASANERKINIPLETKDGKQWTGEIQLLLKQPAELAYYYEVRRGAQTVRSEWQSVARHLYLDPSVSRYFLNDFWRDLPPASWLYTSAATEVFFPRPKHPARPLALFARTLVLRASAALQGKGKLFLCGASKAAGSWNPAHALALTEGEPNE